MDKVKATVVALRSLKAERLVLLSGKSGDVAVSVATSDVLTSDLMF